MRSFIVVTLLTFSALAGFAADRAEVAVLYNGNTPVNTDGLHFMSKQFKEVGTSYKLKPFRDAKKLNVADYKAVLVLNSGLASGLDRTLSDFIKAQTDKSKVILISLRKDSEDFTVIQTPAASMPLGVDAVTAASAWTGKGLGALVGGKPSADYAMHVDWINRVIALIDGKN